MKRVTEVIVVFQDGSRETLSRTSSPPSRSRKAKAPARKQRTKNRKTSKSSKSSAKSKPTKKSEPKTEAEDLPTIELVWDKAKTPQGRPSYLAPFGRHIWYIAKIGSEVRTFLKDVDDDKAPPSTCDTETSVARAKKCALAISQKRHRSDNGFQDWVDKHTKKWIEKVGRTLVTVSGRFELDQTRREGQAAVLVYTGKSGRVEVRVFDPVPYTGNNDSRRKPKYSIWAVEYAADGVMVGWFQAYQVLTVELGTIAMGVPLFRPLEWEFDGNVAKATWGNVTLVVIDGPELANLHVEEGQRPISLRCGNKTMLRRDAVAIYHEYLLEQTAKTSAKRDTTYDGQERLKWAKDLAKRFRVRADLALVTSGELAEAVDLLDDVEGDDYAKFLRAARKELETRGKSKLIDSDTDVPAKKPAKESEKQDSAKKSSGGANKKSERAAKKTAKPDSDSKRGATETKSMPDKSKTEESAQSKPAHSKPAQSKPAEEKSRNSENPPKQADATKKSGKSDAAKTDAVKADAPKTDDAKTDSSKTDTAKADAPKADSSKTDTAKADSSTTDAKQADTKKTGTAKPDTAKTDAPKTDTPKTDKPAKSDQVTKKTDSAKSDAKTQDSKTDAKVEGKSDAKKADTKSHDEKQSAAKKADTTSDDSKQSDAKKADTKADDEKQPDAKSDAKKADTKPDEPKTAKPDATKTDSPAKTSDTQTAKPAKKKAANKPKRDPAPKRPAPVLDDEDDSIPTVTDDFRNKIQKAARSAADELGVR